MSRQDTTERIVALAKLDEELTASLTSEDESDQALEILKEKYLQQSVTEVELREARRVLLEQEASATDGGTASGDEQPESSSAGTSLYLRVELQKGLVKVIKQIDRGYTQVMWMYSVTFLLGIVLVLTAVFASLILNENVSALISLGGAGMMAIISRLIFQPIRELQNSRGKLAQLQGIFINWVNDLHNWNLYLASSANDKRSPIEEIDRISDKLFENTELMMWLIGEYTELQGGQSRESRKRPPRDGWGRIASKETPADDLDGSRSSKDIGKETAGISQRPAETETTATTTKDD